MLTGKVIVVSGGAGLLGRVIAKGILEQGGTVVISDINPEAGADAMKQFGQHAPVERITFSKCDITSRSSIDTSIAEVHGKFGRIDAVVCSAYPKGNNYGKMFEDVTFEDFCNNVNLHLGGYFLTTQRYCKFFSAQSHGNIVIMSSIYGHIAPRFEIYDNTQMTMPVEYATIKPALIHLSKYVSKYFKGKNIRCNCVSPGGIFDRQDKRFIEAYNKHACSKGMLDPEDIVGAVIFLLSDNALYITGQNLLVDDGWTL